MSESTVKQEETTVTLIERENEKTGEWKRELRGRVVTRGRREGKRVYRTHGTYMRFGNALIGLSDGFRVAPYRWDRSRFDKIEFHLESAVPRVCSLLHTHDILF